MPRIDTAFLVLGVMCLVVGVCVGLYMGVNEDFLLAPVHGHLNLVGWVSLTLFGLIYRVHPELSNSALARVHFWLAAPSALVFPIGLYFAIVHQSPILAVVASVVWLLGVLVLLVSVVGLAVSRSRAPVAESRRI